MNLSSCGITAIFAQAQADLAAGRLTAQRLDELRDQLLKPGSTSGVRQRLLYLHAAMPNIHAKVVAAALHEPVAGHLTQCDPLVPDLPFQSVHEALVAGWRIVHFPDQRAPFDDHEIDIVGYEYILEKLEVFDA